MSERRIVRIEYFDHISIESGSLSEIKEKKPLRCVAVGEILEETSDYIKILTYYSLEEKPEASAMIILKSCVVKREELK